MGELEKVLRKAIDAYEKLDVDAIVALSSEDFQGIDEIDPKWSRGIGALKDYLNSLPGQLSVIGTTLSDIHERIYGDTGVVTFWIEQDYTLADQKQHISAPGTAVFRKEGGVWKLSLFHSIPLPEQAN